MATGLVIGGGPAGLMAAEAMALAGVSVIVAEAKPSVGRKLLMAGKSGLNLTKAEAPEDFLAAYEEAAPVLAPMIAAFGPQNVQDWAEGLGQAVFTGSTGRVFPKVMKASPLLRAWLARLDGMGVTVRTRWRWTGWRDGAAVFATPQGEQVVAADATVLAMGGASWARLGSDGAWAERFDTAPFRAANVGIAVDWSERMAEQFGAPVKAVALSAGGRVTRGECVITARGLEGAGVYAISRALRDGAPLTVDLMPDLTVERLRDKLGRRRRGDSLSSHLRRTVRLDPAKRSLLMEFGRPLPVDLAPLMKALPVHYAEVLPMDQAISTAGGLRFAGLDTQLMLLDRPGVFAAGEMLDWEAPTGGYLLTACLATGLWAGRAAADYASSDARARR
jgi:uncharacterized flavoprotein (TIGR03862 family)